MADQDLIDRLVDAHVAQQAGEQPNPARYVLDRPGPARPQNPIQGKVPRTFDMFGTDSVQRPVGGKFGSQEWKDAIPGDAANALVSMGTNALLPGSGPVGAALRGLASGGLGGIAGGLVKGKGGKDIAKDSVIQALGSAVASVFHGNAPSTPKLDPETLLSRGGTIPGTLSGSQATLAKATGNPMLDLASHAGGKIGLLAQLARMLRPGSTPGTVTTEPPLPVIQGGRSGTLSTPRLPGQVPEPGGSLPGQFPAPGQAPLPLRTMSQGGTLTSPLPTPTPPQTGPLSTSIPPGTTMQDMSPLSLAQRAQMARLLRGSGTGIPGPRSFEPEPPTPQQAKNALSDLMARAKNNPGPKVGPDLPPKPDKPMSEIEGLSRALQGLQAAGNPPPGPTPTAAIPPNLQPRTLSAPTGTLQWLLDSLNEQVARQGRQ